MDEYLERYERSLRGADLYGSVFVSPLQALALMAGVSYDTLYRVRSRAKMRTIEFDLADRLLCAMNLVHLWWREPLKEVYLSLDLSEPGLPPGLTTDGLRRCAAEGCSVMFEPPSLRPDKKYCSTACRNRVLNRRQNDSQPRQSKCRNGHWRTEENTILMEDGTRRCRVCQAESRRRVYLQTHPDAKRYGPYEGRSIGTRAEVA